MPYFKNKAWEQDLEICPYCGSDNIVETFWTTSKDSRKKTAYMCCYECNNLWLEEFQFDRRVAMISGDDHKQVDI